MTPDELQTRATATVWLMSGQDNPGQVKTVVEALQAVVKEATRRQRDAILRAIDPGANPPYPPEERRRVLAVMEAIRSLDE